MNGDRTPSYIDAYQRSPNIFKLWKLWEKTLSDKNEPYSRLKVNSNPWTGDARYHPNAIIALLGGICIGTAKSDARR